MKRYAFTMLELVFVIIIIAILAVLAIPNLRKQPLQEAGEQLANHIRYTQHLAMMDDVYDPSNPTWYLRRWSINLCSATYRITRFDGTQLAVDPKDKTTSDYNLTDQFNMSDMNVTSNNCRLVFDSIGRPYVFAAAGNPASAQAGILNENYMVQLNHPTEGNITMTLRPESGYLTVEH